MKQVNLLHNNYNRIGPYVTFQNKHMSNMASKFHSISIVVKEITSNRNISKQINFLIVSTHRDRNRNSDILTAESLSVSLSVSDTSWVRLSRALSLSSCNAFGFAFPIIFSNQSDPTKLLNFASFSHSLRNIQSLYPRGIMYIQSRRNAVKLDTNPSHTTRAKMRDESTCHWEPSFRGAEHGRRIIYVGCSHWPFPLRRHFGARHTRPTSIRSAAVRVAPFFTGCCRMGKFV